MQIFLLISFVVCSVASKAQVQVYNRSLTDSTLPYFYIGVDNEIRIDWKNKLSPNHSISVQNGGSDIMQISGNRYIVRVNAVTDECKVVIRDKSRKVILEKIYKVRTIPEPTPTLAGLRDTSVSLKRILLNPYLKVVYPNCFIKINYSILSFTMTSVIGGDSISISSNGNILSTAQIKVIRETENGNKLFFTDLRGTGPDERARKLKPFWIKIE